jgi:hypothetical protein
LPANRKFNGQRALELKKVKKVIKIFAFGFVFYWLSMTGCSTVNISSLENNPERSTSSTRKTIQNKSRIIKNEGWQIPEIQNLKMNKPTFKDMKSDNGKSFTVKTTYFSPESDIFYTVDGFSKNSTRLFGKLKLYGVKEFSLSGKTFLYEVTAGQVMSNNGENYNSNHGGLYQYILLDNNGDGKFETLIDDYTLTSDVLIPKWATE